MKKNIINHLLKGGIIEISERYYKYDNENKNLYYSDYNINNWKCSRLDIETLLNTDLKVNLI